MALLRDSDRSLRHAVLAPLSKVSAHALSAHGAELLTLTNELGEDDWDDWDLCSEIPAALARLPVEWHVANHLALISLLEHPLSTVREAAVGVLGGLPPELQKQHAAAVLSKTEHAVAMVREAALRLLARLPFGVREQQHAPAALRCLRDEDTYVRTAAIDLLGTMPLLQHGAALVACLDDEEAEIRLHAIEALANASNAP